MDKNRRKFLKLAGLTALGVTVGRYTKIFANNSSSKIPIVKSSSETDLTQRWAMVVDLRKCFIEDNCRLCIDACHKTHNVPDLSNPKDEIKWIWREDFENVFIDQENHYLKETLKQKRAPIFCNHCDNPPCVRVCPTQATWKRDDGIVMMDWHRCIGCRYCIVACPYGSRSFNWKDPRPYIKEITPDYPTRTKGVVEKCTFCDERLARGLNPACVEACTEKALIFGDLNDPKSDVRELLRENFSIRRKPGLGTNPEIFYIV
ncbi:sulfate reduction electron transfer complex DsrMKJOP subunit DsrO [Bacteroidota bacterium]